MDIQEIAAFTDEGCGGNPAGVVVCARLPSEEVMGNIASTLGHSETVFSAPGVGGWDTRYFSPESEIPFCGHATIALGAALAVRVGSGTFLLNTRAGEVTVCGVYAAEQWCATFRSRPTRSEAIAHYQLEAVLTAFGLEADHLDPGIPPARIFAGSSHLLLAVRDRAFVQQMRYDFQSFREVMRQNEWVTVMLCHAETSSVIHARNAFAYGGVYEDPATGAAAAALGGYLRDLGLGNHKILVHQGEDMGLPCRIIVEAEPEHGAPVLVSGSVRHYGKV